MQVFEDRQKLGPKLIALFAFVALALTPNSPALTSTRFWAACAVVQVLLHLWFASRQIVVGEQGIRVVLAWALTARSVSWAQMEEGTLIALVPTRKSALIARAATKSTGPTVDELVLEVIVSNGEALRVHLGDLVAGAAFADLVLSRIPHVRSA